MLYKKYQPQTLDELVGQTKIKTRLQHIMSRDSFDRGAFWFEGPSGSGKTTLAMIIAKQLAGNDIDIREYNGGVVNKGAMNDIERDIRFYPMGGGWKVYIINEAHNMTDAAVQSLLTMLEDLPSKRLVIFTTHMNIDDLFGKHSEPFVSRCMVFRFSSQGLCQLFAVRAKQIAEAEGLDGLPLQRYTRLVQSCKNNMRQVLQRIDSCEMMG